MIRVHQEKLIVQEQHLDTFGHVNNATYLKLFEQARWNWITQAGYGLDRVHQLKKGPVILEINLKFKRELTLRKEYYIKTWAEIKSDKIYKIHQEIYDQDEKLCCQAEFLSAFFDTAKRKIISFTPEWQAVLQN